MARDPHDDLGACVECKDIRLLCQERLCTKCEAQKFPERFNGCPCCLYVQRHSGPCLVCCRGIKHWLAKGLGQDPTDTTTESEALYGLFKNLEPIPFVQEAKYYKPQTNWPGFYLGKGTWTTPEIKASDFKLDDMTETNKSQVLLREFQKNQIPFPRLCKAPIFTSREPTSDSD